jgi:hypothetical protein
VLDLEEQSFLMRSTRQIRFPAQVVFMAGAAKQTSFWAGRFQLFMAGEAKQTSFRAGCFHGRGSKAGEISGGSFSWQGQESQMGFSGGSFSCAGAGQARRAGE